MDNPCGQALDEDILHIAKQYLTNLAALDPDAYVRHGRGETGWGIAKDGRTITVGALLEDTMHKEGWIHAITEFQTAVTRSRQGDWQNADSETRSGVAPIESKIHRETVLEVGAEGGSITLFREARAVGDWQFRMATNELATHDMLSEEDVTGLGPAARETDYVHSFDEGLELLDKYPWFKFVPLQVHAAYRNAVLRAVRERGGPTEETRWKEHLALHRE